MTKEELEDKLMEDFKKDFEYDCYDPSCELCDCCECSTFQDCLEEYKQDLGYLPIIMVGL